MNKRRRLGSVVGVIHDERIGVELAILRRQRLLDRGMSPALDTQRSTVGKHILGHWGRRERVKIRLTLRQL